MIMDITFIFDYSFKRVIYLVIVFSFVAIPLLSILVYVGHFCIVYQLY